MPGGAAWHHTITNTYYNSAMRFSLSKMTAKQPAIWKAFTGPDIPADIAGDGETGMRWPKMEARCSRSRPHAAKARRPVRGGWFARQGHGNAGPDRFPLGEWTTALPVCVPASATV